MGPHEAKALKIVTYVDVEAWRAEEVSRLLCNLRVDVATMGSAEQDFVDGLRDLDVARGIVNKYIALPE